MKELWKGSHAMAEAAIRAGARLYCGYPITPQSEIMEYMSERMPQVGRIFIQAESELVSINTVYGGALTGNRCVTSSSGVGISLMQEGITSCFSKGLPILIINVNRTGAGMGGGGGEGGSFSGGQDDYTRETHGGGNGYYRNLVFIPDSIQEAVDMIYNAWDIAEPYRNPVVLYTEGRLAQMMEAVEMPEFKEREPLDWGVDGTSKEMKEYRAMNKEYYKYKQRIDLMRENEQQWEEYLLDDAEVVVVAVGLCSRVCRGSINKLRAQGVKIGMLRPKAVWPFPQKGFDALPKSVKKIVCVENSSGPEMLEDVIVAMRYTDHLKTVPVYSSTREGLIPTKELIPFLQGVIDGTVKEVG
ncbi:MAG: 3-methyl-2-oxobutanoate dehydrogenase subunit beta [Lachnospiraceae bacterium]|nr:3-methyl-2-oxobutanoate dehydrogenase subunit beta [Lachnospiraceae bacterium]